jgi:GntR family transcriptional repressor for pyruvate dehydrogenase complex
MASKRVGVRSPIEVRRIRPAYLQVSEQLRELILRGDLKPGERLPPEAELAVMFGVSRSTVREALRVLSSQNLIATSRGVVGGSFIAHPDADQVRDQLEVSLGLLSGSAMSVDELLEGRALLEVPAARLAAQRRTPEHVRALDEALSANDVDRLGRFHGHQQFHVAVLRAAGNRMLELMTRPVFNVLQNRVMGTAASPQFWSLVDADHQHIFEAIRDRDAARAGDAMATHLEHLRSTYERVYRAPPDGPPGEPRPGSAISRRAAE